MRSIPLVGWYLDLLIRSAQPRSPDAVERDGIAKFFLGSARPDPRGGNGWWYVRQALMYALVIVGFAFVGLWWFSLILLPFAAVPVAKSVGGFRERI